ncbi:hypothetical protein ACFX14_036248 [Malus domestica]
MGRSCSFGRNPQQVLGLLSLKSIVQVKQHLLKAAMEMTSPEHRPSWSRPWARYMTPPTNSSPVFCRLPVIVTAELRRRVDIGGSGIGECGPLSNYPFLWGVN